MSKTIVFASRNLSGGGLRYLHLILKEDKSSRILILANKNFVEDDTRIKVFNYSIILQICLELYFFRRKKIYLSNKIIFPTINAISIWQNTLPLDKEIWKMTNFSLMKLLLWNFSNYYSFFFAKKIIVLSDYWKSYLINKGINHKKIKVISNLKGINNEIMLPPTKGIIKLLHITNGQGYKGNEELEKFILKLNDVHLDNVGIEGLDSKKVKYHGWLTSNKINQLIKNADCIVMNSYCENSPFIFEETALQSKPLICRWLKCYDDVLGGGVMYFTNFEEFKLSIESLKSTHKSLIINT